jgi:hypothetical protein
MAGPDPSADAQQSGPDSVGTREPGWHHTAVAHYWDIDPLFGTLAETEAITAAAPAPLPVDAEVLLASGPLDDAKLPSVTAAWLRTPADFDLAGQPTIAW